MQRPTNSVLHEIISYLKLKKGWCTREQILKDLRVDIDQERIKDAISKCESISRLDSSLQIKLGSKITSENELLDFIRSRKNLSCIEWSELKSSISGADEMLQKLRNNNMIFEVRYKDEGPRIICYNDLQIQILPDPIAQLWTAINVPLNGEVVSEILREKGLPVSQINAPQKSVPIQASKSTSKGKRPRRIEKTTNDYLDFLN